MLAYPKAFFLDISTGSLESARVVLPIVFRLVRPTSVVDVGSGLGAWAATAIELGVRDVMAVDGAYVPDDKLLVPRESFIARDLSSPFTLGRTFDIALCMEVAEHLPTTSARGFVLSLTELAPVVLFSAAIPGQGGTNHINEQWPQYWTDLFQGRNFVPLDLIRPLIWNCSKVEWWYRQNVLLYAHVDWLRNHPEIDGVSRQEPMALVHPCLFERETQALKKQLTQPGFTFLLSSLPGAFVRAIKRRLHAQPRKDRT